MAVEKAAIMNDPLMATSSLEDSLREAEDIEVEIDLGEEGAEEVVTDEGGSFSANLALTLSDDALTEIANEVIEGFDGDVSSRQQWEEMLVKGVKMLGLRIDPDDGVYEGSCTVTHPLLIENVVKFQSKASQELFPSKGPVKTQILGQTDLNKEKQANRVKNFMNWQYTVQMPEAFEEFEKLLFHVGLFGSAFKKTVWEAPLARPNTYFISPDRFVVPYRAQTMLKAQRMSEILTITPQDYKAQAGEGKLYRDVELGSPTTPQTTDLRKTMDEVLGITQPQGTDLAYEFIEQHVNMEIDGEYGPFIVTVDRSSKKILSIYRNWREGDETKTRLEYFTHYCYVPGFGFYGLGLCHFIGNIQYTATSILRSLVDSGEFANMQGGFKTKRIRISDPDDPLAPGEWRDVEATIDDLSKGFVPIPAKEPSATLYNLLNTIVQSGQKFADSTEQVIADSTNYGPMGTTLALLDASQKFFTAIHKRLHKSLSDEFKILKRLDSDYLPKSYPYNVPGEAREVFAEDFNNNIDVIPVSDPNIPSMAHRVMQGQMLDGLAKQSPPGMYNLQEVHAFILENSGIESERFFNQQQSPEPSDPMTDVAKACKGLPVIAIPGQNHDAYIQIFTSFMQNPQNVPLLQQAGPILSAAVQQHTLLKWQEQVMAFAQQEGVDPQSMGITGAEPVIAMAAQKVAEIQQQLAQGGPKSPDQMIAESAVMTAQAKVQDTVNKNKQEAEKLRQKQQEIDQNEDKIKLEAIRLGKDIGNDKEKNRLQQLKIITDNATKRQVAKSTPKKS